VVPAGKGDPFISAQLVIAIVLGGSRHFLAPAIGAVAVTVLHELALRASLSHGLVLGALLVAAVFAFPGGVASGITGVVDKLKALRALGRS